MLPFFTDLMMRTDEARRAFETNPVVVKAGAEGMSVERYRALLLELYHIVWHFNTVSAAGASRVSDKHKQVRYFLYEHMHEEKGHEEWVLADLREMGVPTEVALAHEPSPDTLAMNGYNYFAADRGHPVSVLGMLYALEVIASVYGGTLTTALKEALLLEDERGTSFIGSHATLDAEHMDELRQVLDTIEDDEARDAVVESVKVNFHLITRIMEVI
jgi:pyrroloquinoline quinone (PQQ) biosynthesis protein C